MLTLSLVMLGVGLVGVAERHDGRWSDVRNSMQNYVDSVARVTGMDEGGISDSEYATIRKRYVPEQIPAYLPGCGRVWVKNWGERSEVVLFIEGNMARYDRITMYCLNSD